MSCWLVIVARSPVSFLSSVSVIAASRTMKTAALPVSPVAARRSDPHRRTVSTGDTGTSCSMLGRRIGGA
jgi:hypothetical protein